MAFLTMAGSAWAYDWVYPNPILEEPTPSSGCPNTMITLTEQNFGKTGCVKGATGATGPTGAKGAPGPTDATGW
jgi:hypothetical protein